MTRAFSFIELLVTMSAIAMLVILLLPSLQKSRGGARIIGCQSNFRQLALIFQAYQDDHKGFYPNAKWQDGIKRYVTNQQIALCPNAPETNKSGKKIEVSYLFTGVYWPDNQFGDHLKYFSNGKNSKLRRHATHNESIVSHEWTAALSEHWIGKRNARNAWGRNWLNDRTLRSVHVGQTSHLLMVDAHVEAIYTGKKLYQSIQMKNSDDTRNDALFNTTDAQMPTILKQR